MKQSECIVARSDLRCVVQMEEESYVVETKIEVIENFASHLNVANGIGFLVNL